MSLFGRSPSPLFKMQPLVQLNVADRPSCQPNCPQFQAKSASLARFQKFLDNSSTFELVHIQNSLHISSSCKYLEFQASSRILQNCRAWQASPINRAWHLAFEQQAQSKQLKHSCKHSLSNIISLIRLHCSLLSNSLKTSRLSQSRSSRLTQQHSAKVV